MANKDIVYIAGKIAGDENYREKFKLAQTKLEAKGFIVLNPAELPEGMPYESYMKIGFAMIDMSNIMYMLKDYKDSPGANRELTRGLNAKHIKEILFEELGN